MDRELDQEYGVLVAEGDRWELLSYNGLVYRFNERDVRIAAMKHLQELGKPDIFCYVVPLKKQKSESLSAIGVLKIAACGEYNTVIF
jgi:hypothetical protein